MTSPTVVRERQHSTLRAGVATAVLAAVLLLGAASLGSEMHLTPAALTQAQMPQAPVAVCAKACATCDRAAMVAACDSVVPQPHDAASELQDMALAASCAEKVGCGSCLSCLEQHNGATAAAEHDAQATSTNLDEQGFFSALQTSGSFVMMGAGGF
jgi:hypothetical protein